MERKLILFSTIVIVVSCFKRSTAGSLRREYIGSCTYNELHVSNTVNDIVTLVCSDTDTPTNKVFPQLASVYLECSNKRKTNGYQVGNVVFKGCQMSRIKYNISTVFIRFHTLNVSGIELQSLPSSFFNGAKFLKTLIASENRLLEIPSFQFSQCPLLTDVDYSYNKISHIAGNAFGGLSGTMKKLNLSHNHLAELPSNFFSNLSQLEILDMSHNNIAHLVTFSNFSKLVHLNLSYNHIMELSDATILNQPDLQFLHLSHNNLTTINMETFARQAILHLLDFSYNSIKRINFNMTRMEHLEKFHINNNQLSDLGGFKNLLFPVLNSFAIIGNKFNCSYLTTFLNQFDYHSSLSVLYVAKSTYDNGEMGETEVNGMRCSNVTNPSTFQTEAANHTSNNYDRKATTVEYDVQSAGNIVTSPTIISLYNETKESSRSHDKKHLLIVLCVSVAINVGVLIFMIIRKRKSVSITGATNHHCSSNKGVDQISLHATENQYETIMVPQQSIPLKRCDDSDADF